MVEEHAWSAERPHNLIELANAHPHLLHHTALNQHCSPHSAPQSVHPSFILIFTLLRRMAEESPAGRTQRGRPADRKIGWRHPKLAECRLCCGGPVWGCFHRRCGPYPHGRTCQKYLAGPAQVQESTSVADRALQIQPVQIHHPRASRRLPRAQQHGQKNTLRHQHPVVPALRAPRLHGHHPQRQLNAGKTVDTFREWHTVTSQLFGWTTSGGSELEKIIQDYQQRQWLLSFLADLGLLQAETGLDHRGPV